MGGVLQGKDLAKRCENRQFRAMRMYRIILPLALTFVVAVALLQVSYGYFQSEEQSKAEGRLSLYRSSVSAELERFSHLTHVLSRDTHVIAATRGNGLRGLNARLEGFATRAGLDAIYLMGRDGMTVAASNHASSGSFIGQSYAFRPYFRTALTGAQGRFYAIGATTGQPGYFIAEAVRDEAGEITGVIAIKIDLSALEQRWRVAGEQVLLANADGVVLLGSDPDWRYHALTALTPEQRTRMAQARQFIGQPLNRLDWQPASEGHARISGRDWLHLTALDLPHDWQLHYFASDDRAVARSWLVTVIAMLAAGGALILYQIARARRVGAALRRSEREEAELRRANERLAVEIEERITAERRLSRTRSELERASRLAALGQLAASVTHELGQPIAAMRNHLAAAEIAGGLRPALTGQIGGLVDRMEGITRQLKFFAKPDMADFADVDLSEAVHAAVGLVEPNIHAGSVRIELDLPDLPVLMRGSRLRIEQVLTNLLRNALDAVEDVADPAVRVQAGQSDGSVWVEIRDNGHGLGAATLAELQEPFVTTRASGRGMGLGLAISASIVKDHGGTMSARNLDGAGAAFTLRFADLNTAEGDRDD